ncbi:hypothetical protein GQ457_02G033030 [Hibiscus cannabinus]
MTRANPRGPRFDYDPKIERTQRRLKQGIHDLMNNNRNIGQQPADGQELPARADGAIAPPAPQMNQQLPARTVRDYLAEDLEGLNPAVTMPDFEAEHFELKPVMFNMLNTLGQFGGTPNENARQHYKFSQRSPGLLKLLYFMTSRVLIGLRHKPITLQDALPRSDSRPRFSAKAGPVVSVRDIPFVILLKENIDAPP